MKKRISAVLSVIFAVLMTLSCVAVFSSCGKTADVDAIKKAGKLVVGVTDYAPYDYQNQGSEEWVGFDADMARLVAQKLGVDVEFVEIDWDTKEVELKAKKIDVIWNGMTVSDDLAANMDFSYSYAQNSQVLVIKKNNASVYTTVDSLKGKSIAVENGSAGNTVAEEQFGKDNIVAVKGMVKALFEVNAGTSEAAVVDYALAASLCGSGDYADLMIIEGLSFGQEEFAVGCRKGSDLVAVINEVLVAAYKDGTMASYRAKYGEDVIALCDLSGK